MAHRDFRAAVREAVGEPVTFTIGDGNGFREEFTVPTPLPAFPLLDLAATEAGSDAESYAAFGRFLYALIDPADHGRFRKACIRARFNDEEILDLTRWLVSETTGRPTLRPSGSPERSSTTGPPSPTESDETSGPTPSA